MPQQNSTPENSRPPISWSTHGQIIGSIIAATVGGTMFGLAFALWPQSSVERGIGIVILAAVIGLLGWVIGYLRKPVIRSR
ncbi:hypothetical protein NODU109028_03125 [Nocardioides dubius]|uniref:Uncharacterized protein n=1 Tax=Nocardioides dubius TaxID=317019 RepID=A0ABN1TMH0_9ACTN